MPSRAMARAAAAMIIANGGGINREAAANAARLTESEARKIAEAAAATFYADSLLGKVTRCDAIQVATRALLLYDAEKSA